MPAFGEPITREEIDAVYINLTNLANVLIQYADGMSASDRIYEVINAVEIAAESVGERQPRVDQYIRAAAAALDELRSVHDGLGDEIIKVAEGILKAEVPVELEED